MSPRYHRLPRSLFDALAVGGGGTAAIRELAAGQYSKHVILLCGVLSAARSAGSEQYRLACRGYELLAAVQLRNPAAAGTIIRYPSVGAWARRTIRASRGGQAWPGAELSGLGAVAAAAAIMARTSAEIEVGTTGGKVVLPAIGAATAGGNTAVVRSSHGRAEVWSAGRRVAIPVDPQENASGWLALRRVRVGRLDLVIDDLDPFRMPTSAGLLPRLTEVEFAKWEATLRDAWSLLEVQHPDIAAEVAEAVSVIVPCAHNSDRQLSSSSAETFGAISMSRPVDPRTCAVTFAHEVQHLKLFALIDIAALTLPDDGRLYYAPWRDDPRPIDGLLQGAYAHLGVCQFWRRQRQFETGTAVLRAHSEFARWRTAAAQVVGTLQSSGRLTPVGLDLVRGMAKTLASWQSEPIPADAQALARHEAELHLTRWQANYGTLPAS